MTDIHTHILPHLDDGAKDSETSRALLQAEQQQGVTTVVFTPHFYGKRHSPTQFLEKRNKAFERIKAQIPQGMQTRLGAEVHFTGINIPEYSELCKLAIEGTNYILLELPFTSKWTGEITSLISDFVYETEYTPIIAHVERYSEVLKKPSILGDFVQMGCLIQVNAEAFLHTRDKKFAFALLKHGLVHCIGSDAHDLEERCPRIAEAKEAVGKAGYAEEWDRAQDIMKKVLANEKVEIPEYSSVKKFFGSYR